MKWEIVVLKVTTKHIVYKYILWFLDMKTKVFKAGDFVIWYFVLVTCFASDQKFDSDQLKIKLWAGRGTYLHML